MDIVDYINEVDRSNREYAKASARSETRAKAWGLVLLIYF